MIKFAIIVLAAMGVAEAASQCGVCMANKASCETESSYHICLGENKIGPFTCDADKVCTNSENVCEQKTNIQGDTLNVCGDDNGACQTCANGKLFTCASRTQGARCVNGAMSTSIIFDCGEDEICVSEAEDIADTVCVPKCAADFIKWTATCSNDVYTPPTLEPPTTPSPTVQQSLCADAAVGKTTRFFYAYGDSSCRSYVYCERNSVSNSYFETTFAGSCSSPNPYFNTAIGRCQARVPENCSTDAPTTIAPETTTTPEPTTTTTEAPTTTTPEAQTTTTPEAQTTTTPEITTTFRPEDR
ncbi:hypothetical protein ACLKA7_016526 [Drosophila subpalustris]